MRMMKFFAVTVMWVLLGSISVGYSGGDGSSGNPYQIADRDDLLELAGKTVDYSKCFILTADIDLDPNLPGGQIFTTALIAPDTSSSSNFQGTKFSGVFDGNHHIISNLSIAASGNNYIGLFGYVSLGGIIRNLGVINVDIDGFYFVGGLLGFNSSGTLTSCYSTGSIVGTGWNVGGLVGYSEGLGAINQCYSRGTVSGNSSVGGLAGANYGNIIDCYSTSSVIGTSSVGGLIGDNGYKISNSYSTGVVSGASNVGGLTGVNGIRGSVLNCFWDINTSDTTDGVGNVNPDPAGVTGKTTAEMKTLSIFTSASANWDFTNETTNGTNDYWRMCVDGVDYPRLNWESIDGDFACPDGVSVEDLDYFVGRWLLSNCTSSNNYCGGGDVNASGAVDLGDFAVLAGHWLEGV